MNKRIKELAEQAGLTNTLGCFWQSGDNQLERFAELIRADERDACVKAIEEYQIPIGNSPAGELAAEYTLNALKDIRDEIRGRTT